MKNRFASTLICALLSMSVLPSCTSHARPTLTPPPHTAAELDQYFISIMKNYDINHDERLSEDEFTRAAMAMFESIDRNSDDMLDKEEMGARWNTNCALADSNHDEALSLMEVLRDQNNRFKSNDLDHNGFLDHNELHTLLIQKFQHNP